MKKQQEHQCTRSLMMYAEDLEDLESELEDLK